MTLVAPSTAWKGCREALATAIFEKFGDKISGPDWTTKKPGAPRPAGLGSKDTAWKATLDRAQEILTKQGYSCTPIDITEIAPLLNAFLTRSTRCLYEHLSAMRAAR